MDPFRATQETIRQILWGTAGPRTFFEGVLARIGQWNPQRIPGWKELDYQKDLIKTFKPSDVVEVDKPRKGCDIEVRWLYGGRVKEKIAIETKLDDFSVKDLVGAVDIYRKDYNGIIVVLLGNPPMEKESQIKAKLLEIENIYKIPTALVRKKF